MKERIAPTFGHVHDGDKSSRAVMVVLIGKGETYGEALTDLQAKIESVTVTGPGEPVSTVKPGTVFTPLT